MQEQNPKKISVVLKDSNPISHLFSGFDYSKQYETRKKGIDDESTNFLTNAKYFHHDQQTKPFTPQKIPKFKIIKKHFDKKNRHSINVHDIKSATKKNFGQNYFYTFGNENSKGRILIKIYDWMLEIASTLKYNKNIVYRAAKIIMNFSDYSKVESNLCQIIALAALSLSAKIENGIDRHVQMLTKACGKKIESSQIVQMQLQILKKFMFSLPIQIKILEDIASIKTKWVKFISENKLIKYPIWRLNIFQETAQAISTYIKFIYLLDLISLSTQKYLEQSNFTIPLTISLCSVMLYELEQEIPDSPYGENYLTDIFQIFLKNQLKMSFQEIFMWKQEFVDFLQNKNILQALNKIPEQILLNNEQFKPYVQLYIAL